MKLHAKLENDAIPELFTTISRTAMWKVLATTPPQIISDVGALGTVGAENHHTITKRPPMSCAATLINFVRKETS